LIVFSRDLLFVHNPKTAGTSLIRFWQEALSGDIHMAGVRELGTHHPHLAESLAYARAVLGAGDEAPRHVVAVLRDPLDRERSMYAYYRHTLSSSPGLAEDLPDPVQREAVRMATLLSFADWLAWQGETFGHCDLWRSRLYYQLPDGQSPPHLRIARFERLEEDILAVMDELRLTAPYLPRLNVSERDTVPGDPGDAARALIERSYAWIETLDARAFVGARG